MVQPLQVRRLGRESYEPVWQRMGEFTDRRGAEAGDELWLVEHPPVFTLGQAGKREHILAPGDIPVVKCDRGGQVTYHGPGQLVAYPLLNLKRRNIGVRALVETLEEILIHTLRDYGVAAQRQDGAPGVYVQGAKIAALGLRIRRGCSFHGISLNVDMDLEPFRRINPCGYAGLQVAQLRTLVGGDPAVSLDIVGRTFVRKFCELLDYEPQWSAPESGHSAPLHSSTLSFTNS
ncbi:lipoyl(octanoyl) transferase LipB [Gilvimarinus sp. F26214L]|uniref:lipoyl(octanoyl) transferase LipB n=1 Tax=Gilvimarinus sp. DZF01 TaxID=3461371 RepID=UPI0040456703